MIRAHNYLKINCFLIFWSCWGAGEREKEECGKWSLPHCLLFLPPCSVRGRRDSRYELREEEGEKRRRKIDLTNYLYTRPLQSLIKCCNFLWKYLKTISKLCRISPPFFLFPRYYHRKKKKKRGNWLMKNVLFLLFLAVFFSSFSAFIYPICWQCWISLLPVLTEEETDQIFLSSKFLSPPPKKKKWTYTSSFFYFFFFGKWHAFGKRRRRRRRKGPLLDGGGKSISMELIARERTCFAERDLPNESSEKNYKDLYIFVVKN